MIKRLFSLGIVVFRLALAQGTDAVISGTVVDSSGAVLGGTSVVAINVRTGVRISTTSNEAGVYLYPSLQPGVYQLTAEQVAGVRLLRTETAVNVDLLDAGLPERLHCGMKSLQKPSSPRRETEALRDLVQCCLMISRRQRARAGVERRNQACSMISETMINVNIAAVIDD